MPEGNFPEGTIKLPGIVDRLARDWPSGDAEEEKAEESGESRVETDSLL